MLYLLKKSEVIKDNMRDSLPSVCVQGMRFFRGYKDEDFKVEFEIFLKTSP
ncbi:MAG: hypothetical protein K2P17_00375 [Helicobacteraceae bacterium]|nr:hypothetical protein [Helicobacteraceae bacterium]